MELVVINAFLFDVFHDLMRFGVPVLVWDWFVAFFEKNVFVVALEFHKILYFSDNLHSVPLGSVDATLTGFESLETVTFIKLFFLLPTI